MAWIVATIHQLRPRPRARGRATMAAMLGIGMWVRRAGVRARPLGVWCTAASVALVAPLAPQRAAAASTEPTAAAASGGEEPGADAQLASTEALAKARTLYERGKARFATADYLGAIDEWTEAFALVPDEAEAARIKALLIYNIATARENAFDISGDLSHLRQAKVLMEGYAASIPALYGDGPEAEEERTKITQRLNAIVARLDAAERERARARGDRGDDGPDDRDRGERGSKALVGSGAALLVVGAGGLAMMGAGLAMGKRANDLGGIDPEDIAARRDQFDRGRTGNALAIAGGVVGGLFAITGAVLLGVGMSRRAGARKHAWAPVAAPGFAGVALRGRF
ncbi:MAG: hypothetical protein K1X88_25945 [Nannocystaceae bacterium]|nr:hypothetical protein [Nannocystaceae bacterium]